MANTTSANLKLTVQQTGENAGTWGQVTNTNLLILEQAIGGYDAINSASGATLTFSNGALSNGKNQIIKLTGSISGNVNVVIPDSIEKTYIVENATIGAHTVTFKTSSGTGITWSATDKGKKILYSDGTNIEEGITSIASEITSGIATNTIYTSNLTVTNDTNVSGITISDNVTAANNITTTSGDIVASSGAITASGNITSSTGDIISSAGDVISTAGAVTASGNITSSTGDIISTAGAITASGNITSSTGDLISTAGDVTSTAGDMTDQKGEVRTVPANTQASPYTLVASDHGKVIIASDTITVPAGIFSVGQTISIYNNTAGDISINRSSVSMYWVTDGTNADRTLSTRGVATVLCVGTDTFVITGGTLS